MAPETTPLSSSIAPPGNAHLRDAHDLAREQGVDPRTGLPDDEAAQRALQHGANELQDHARRSPLALLADQFKDFMVLVLLGAAVISGVIGDLTDTLVILVIVVLNAIIGFVQAWRADQAMAALRQLSAAHATVLRGGEVQVVPASVLVPGDIVLLEAGNQIPADLRLIEIAQLQVDESALTGESVTVAKQTDTLAAQDTSALGDRVNMAFKGTTATHGRARGLVVATGMHTELGKVARLLGGEDRSTPLQLRLAAFGKRLALGVIAICIVIFVVGVARGESPLLMALTAISLAVAAIPEALPAVVTVLLALGARRMVAVKALVRRLPSVETLGSVTTICSDKTGTLTQNHMHAELLLALGQRWAPGDPLPGPVHAEALRAAALCNDAVRHARSDDDGAPTTPGPAGHHQWPTVPHAGRQFLPGEQQFRDPLARLDRGNAQGIALRHQPIACQCRRNRGVGARMEVRAGCQWHRRHQCRIDREKTGDFRARRLGVRDVMHRTFDREAKIALELPPSGRRVGFWIAKDRQVMDGDDATLPARRQKIIGPVKQVRPHDRSVPQIARPFTMLAQPAIHNMPPRTASPIDQQARWIDDPLAIAVESDFFDVIHQREALCQFPAIAADPRKARFQRLDRKNESQAHGVISITSSHPTPYILTCGYRRAWGNRKQKSAARQII